MSLYAGAVRDGDVTDFCEGNFDGDLDEDGTDAFKFKTDFGRSSLNNPCPPYTALVPPNPLPDLIIQSMVMNPAQPMQGQYVTIDITVKNRGQADSSSCYLEWYEHLDAPPLLYQIGNLWTVLPALAPSASYTWSFGYAFTTEGDFNMYVQIDSSAIVGESIEDNNIYVTHKIDIRALGAQTLSFEVRLQPGQTITFRGELLTTSEPKR